MLSELQRRCVEMILRSLIIGAVLQMVAAMVRSRVLELTVISPPGHRYRITSRQVPDLSRSSTTQATLRLPSRQ